MNPFNWIKKGRLVEVWMGPPGHPESEFVMAVDESLLPALIACLRSVNPKKS